MSLRGVGLAVGVLVALLALALLLGQVLPGGEEAKVAIIVGVLVVVGLVLGKLVKPHAGLRWPMRIATVGAGVLILGWYGLSLRGEEVQEELVEVPAVSASEPAAGSSGGGGSSGRGGSSGGDDDGAQRRPSGPQLLGMGRFRALDHPGRGRAEVVRSGGRTLVQLRDFQTDAGPDLRLYLSTDDQASDFVDLGELKGNSGNQRYTVPSGTNVERFDTVLVWCRAFSVPFTAATLRRG